MRFYLKFLASIALFAWVAAAGPGWRAVADAAADVRVALVYRFGSAGDVEALIDDIQHDSARRCGALEYHTKSQRYVRLLNKCLAEAAAGRDTPVDDDEYCRIRAACTAEVFGAGRNSAAAGTDKHCPAADAVERPFTFDERIRCESLQRWP
jgi:hypothetical protein